MEWPIAETILHDSVYVCVCACVWGGLRSWRDHGRAGGARGRWGEGGVRAERKYGRVLEESESPFGGQVEMRGAQTRNTHTVNRENFPWLLVSLWSCVSALIELWLSGSSMGHVNSIQRYHLNVQEERASVGSGRSFSFTIQFCTLHAEILKAVNF